MILVRREELWDTRVGVLFEVLHVYFSPVLSMKGGLQCNKAACVMPRAYLPQTVSNLVFVSKLIEYAKCPLFVREGYIYKIPRKGYIFSTTFHLCIHEPTYGYPHITEVTSSGVLY